MKGIAWRMRSTATGMLYIVLLAEAAAATSQLAQNAQTGVQPGARAQGAPRNSAQAPAAQGAPRNSAQAPAAQAPAAQAPAAPAQQQPSPPPPQIPTRTEILNFENWVVTCNEFAEGPRTRVCSALLRILQQNTNQVVFSWTLAMDNNKQLITVMETPTGVAIPPGVELRIGKSPGRKIPFASCDSGRCVATATMDANLLREMTTSPTAEAVIQGSQGNTVQFNIQMNGFDKAYTVLSRS
jgi:invasion protein IalB